MHLRHTNHKARVNNKSQDHDSGEQHSLRNRLCDGSESSEDGRHDKSAEIRNQEIEEELARLPTQSSHEVENDVEYGSRDELDRYICDNT